jgi:hypothetical protein
LTRHLSLTIGRYASTATAFNTTEIVPGLNVSKTGFHKQCPHRCRLVVAVLQQQPPAVAQMARSTFDDVPNVSKTINT